MNHFALFIIGLALFASNSLAQRPPEAVFVQEIKPQQLVESIEALGTLRANESTLLSATVTETITAIHFDDNQAVKQGDVLVEMTSAEERAQLYQAQSALDEAKRQWQRLQTLRKDNLSTEAQLDQQKTLVDAAAAQLKAVKSRLQDRLIIAPFDGVVGLRNVSLGALVRPGDVITTLDDTRVMKLDITVPSVHLDKIAIGMHIEAQATALKEQQFAGELSSISSRVDPITRSVTARALINNPSGALRPGLLMTVNLEGIGREALTLDEEAVIQVGRKSFVYVVDESKQPNTVEKREVTLGERQKHSVEVLSGLQQGELVVVHGGLKLRPGAEVLISAVMKEQERLEQLLSK